MTLSLPRSFLVGSAALCFFALLSSHAQILGPTPALSQGNEAATNTEYAIFYIPAQALQTASASGMPATLSIQCSQSNNHRSVDMFFDPSGESKPAFRALDMSDNSPPHQKVKISLDMGGMKTFKLLWKRRPSGEYHYMNPAVFSGNMQSPLFVMQWMYSSRVMRVSVEGVSAEYEFHVSNLVTAASASPLCKP